MNRKLFLDCVIDNNDENDGEKHNFNIDDMVDHNDFICNV